VSLADYGPQFVGHRSADYMAQIYYSKIVQKKSLIGNQNSSKHSKDAYRPIPSTSKLLGLFNSGFCSKVDGSSES
jgi:hypothetical protein